GETGCRPPSQVYFFGIGAPGAKAGLVIANGDPDNVKAARRAGRTTSPIVADEPESCLARRRLSVLHAPGSAFPSRRLCGPDGSDLGDYRTGVPDMHVGDVLYADGWPKWRVGGGRIGGRGAGGCVWGGLWGGVAWVGD